MTRKVSAEVDLVHQQTQNQRYGSSHIGATAKDISNVVTDAASGVVDIFHGIDKAVADTWNNFWKDGKADGIGSNLSFFFQAEDGIRDATVTGVQTCALPIWGRDRLPQLLAAVCIVTADHAFDVAVEDDPAPGRQDAADRRILEVDGPLALARHGIARIQMPVGLPPGRMLRDLIAAEEQPGGRLRHRRLLLDSDLLAHLHRGVVPEAGLGAVRAGVPAPPAGDPRADEVRRAEPRGVAPDELTRLRVDPLHP